MSSDYRSFFQRASAKQAEYPYQARLALADQWPKALTVPTGVGKTAAVILAWLYRRRSHPEQAVRLATPRRLIYCLPMRTLVEQTATVANAWLDRLGWKNDVMVHVLMGGVEAALWDEQPERDALIIGTQDMLLSRALNRGYSMSRYRWPVSFALLNNDCLWVLDETQLMGPGLTTSAQLAGLREKLSGYGPNQTLWMSATLDQEALHTIDHRERIPGDRIERLQPDDLALDAIQTLVNARKPISQANTGLTSTDHKDYAKKLAAEVLTSHRPGTLTLVVVNRVNRAQDLFRELKKAVGSKPGSSPEFGLIHSRFRPEERQPNQRAALEESTIDPDGPGRVVVATQAIEAGVDVSATTMFTEVAPWPSLVQRFGRCNRRGLCGVGGAPAAQVYWIPFELEGSTKAKDFALPYSPEPLQQSQDHLRALTEVGPNALQAIEHQPDRPTYHVLRRKDLLDLFDTTPDLSGNDMDVSRFIRESTDTDVQVYWRDWDLKQEKGGAPPDPQRGPASTQTFPRPVREELCSAPVSGFREFVEKRNTSDSRLVWSWNPLEAKWVPANKNQIQPGMVFLAHLSAGGYDPLLGWTADPKHIPTEVANQLLSELDMMDADLLGERPLALADHLRDVANAATALQQSFGDSNQRSEIPWNSMIRAAWWHDVGKSHAAFQSAMRDSPHVQAIDPAAKQLWAKSGMRGMPRYRVQRDGGGEVRRPGFRHELASMLAWLTRSQADPREDLVAYLIAAHHGKLRLSLRSMPNEEQPKSPTTRFARGVWDGDELPSIELGNGDVFDGAILSLDLMELGDHGDEPSWLTRTLGLVEEFGPFRLAYLEMLLRVADWRGSAADHESRMTP